MSIPPAPAPQDTPAVPQSAPDGTPDAQTINWEQRYNDLRPQFDRTAQEAATLRAEQERLNDEEHFKTLMAERGYQVEEPDPGYIDPTAQTLQQQAQQLAELQQWRETQQQQANDQRNIEHIGRGLLEAQGALGRELTPDEVQILGDAASASLDDQGLPNITAVTQRWMAAREADMKSWAQTKKTAPRISATGQEGTQAPNLDDPDQRLAWQMQRLADLNAPA
jgi:hypothetical protein